MATSFYIDCNRMNSVRSDDNTNEWEYKYSDEGVILPQGTQISLVDTFINKRGISGNSITIEEDIEESIAFCFYHSDNGMIEPDGSPTTAPNGGGYKNIYAQGRQSVNGSSDVYFKRNADGTNPLRSAPQRGTPDNRNNGYTELPLFACKIHNDANYNTIGFLQPIVERVRIYVPKGTYGVVELGKLIDDQLTGRLVDVKNGNFDLDYYKSRKNLGRFNGTLENSTTYKLVDAVNSNPQTNGNFDYVGRSPLTVATSGGPTANWAIPPVNSGLFMPVNKFRKLIGYWQQPPGAEPVPREASYLNQTCGRGQAGAVYYNGLIQNKVEGDGHTIDFYGLIFRRRYCEIGQGSGGGFEPPATRRMYDLTHKGYYIGTSDIQFQWDGDKSAFTIGGLHQQYRVSSHDQYNNKNESEGEKCVILRRPTQEVEGSGVDETTLSCWRNPVERYGGICVYNWAQDTALKYSDVDHTNAALYNQSFDNMAEPGKNTWTFQQFFSSEKKAKEAWKKTLWHRLGFRYEDLQSSNSWEQNKYWDNDITEDTKNYGKTTRAELGIDSAPTISTIHHPKTYGQNEPIRLYNNMDISTCLNNYNATQNVPGCNPAQGTNAGQFEGSNWLRSTAATILTEGKPIAANNLPALNTQGYFIVTSDIVEGYQDSSKNDKNLPLLGVVPISNLASQDFITTRNILVHTLAQERVMNKIKIKILNPDLTNPELDEFSSVVLRIDIPLQNTDLRQSALEYKKLEPREEKKKEIK